MKRGCEETKRAVKGKGGKGRNASRCYGTTRRELRTTEIDNSAGVIGKGAIGRGRYTSGEAGKLTSTSSRSFLRPPPVC